MANTYYGMGQYRYKSSNINYISEIPQNVDYTTLNTTTYRDLIITPSNNFKFQKNKSYYLELNLPQNTIYDISLNIKLMKQENDTLKETEYQQIRRITIPKNSTNVNTSKIVLYKDVDNPNSTKVYAGIVRNSSNECEPFDLIFDSDEDGYRYKKFQIDNDNDNNNSLNDNNDNNENEDFSNNIIDEESGVFIEIPQSFNAQSTDSYKTFKLIFSPKADVEFNRIILEIVRSDYEEDIFYTVNETTYQGLYIDKDKTKFTISLSEITELLGSEISQLVLSHIGV